MDGNQTPNSVLLETFDGDIDDLMMMNPQITEPVEPVQTMQSVQPVSVEAQNVQDEVHNNIEEIHMDSTDEVLYQREDDVEVTSEAQTENLRSVVNDANSNQANNINQNWNQPNNMNPIQPVTPMNQIPGNHGIDVNDPHYANYKPDPYYEYGIGPEPKMPVMHGDATAKTLAGLSLGGGIASVVIGTCGMNYLFSLMGIITGIWCLCLKEKRGRAQKNMAIVGIALSAVSAVMHILVPIGLLAVDYLSNI